MEIEPDPPRESHQEWHSLMQWLEEEGMAEPAKVEVEELAETTMVDWASTMHTLA